MPKDDRQNSNVPKQLVILDTNVFDYFSKGKYADGIIANLKEATNAGFGLGISDYSFFELVDGANTNREKACLDSIGNMQRFFVSQEVLIAAGHLGTLYNEEGYNINDDGDKIIGATAILTNSLVYTFNGTDYPRPFFEEVASRVVFYEQNNHKQCLVAYFLKPSYIVINNKFEHRK